MTYYINRVNIVKVATKTYTQKQGYWVKGLLNQH